MSTPKVSSIIKGREISLQDKDLIEIDFDGTKKDVQVQWYLEKVDRKVYPYDDDHSIDYILGVYSHIMDTHPIDRICYFMIHNKNYRMYSNPEGINITVKLRNVRTNNTLYENTFTNIRYPNHNTFNSIMNSNKNEYEKFNGIPKNKYKDILDIIGEDDKCLIIDSGKIESDELTLSENCYLLSKEEQVTLKIEYPEDGECIEVFDIHNDINGIIGIPQYINTKLDNYSESNINNYDQITEYPSEHINIIKSIIDNIDFYQFASAQSMFASANGTTNYSTLNLSEIDFEKIYNARFMFNGCTSLTNLILGDNFTTKNIQDMSGMLNNCNSLSNLNIEIDLSSIVSTNNVSNMFSGCHINSGSIVFINVPKSIFEDGNRFVEVIDGGNITSVLKVCFDDGEEVTEFESDMNMGEE